MKSRTGIAGLLRRMSKDVTANTLAISAAAVIPMVGVIGGGVDASRMYMAKARLQQACDSATLAARKKLGSGKVQNGEIPAEIESLANNFFETNFKPGTYGTKETDFELTTGNGTRMDGVADTKIPTTMMAMFGYENVDIDVECSADLNLPNIDIVLVLDNSGSMRNSRIAGLKSAVYAFYDEIMAVKPADARVRIGILPYNASVNVGGMLSDLDTNYIADSFTYQSREAMFDTVIDDPGHPGSPGTPGTPGEEIKYYDQRWYLPKDKSNLGSENYNGNGSDNHFRWSSNENHGTYGRTACDAMDGTYTVQGERWVISDDDYYSDVWSNGNGNWRGVCVARIQKFRMTEGTPGTPAIPARPATYKQVFREYEYKPMVFDTSSYKLGNIVSTKTGLKGASVSNPRWEGCIEEAKTVATTNFDPIPSAAYDLDIDHVPTAGDPESQWRPMWPSITFDRHNNYTRNPKNTWTTQTVMGSRGYSCPVPAFKLQEYPLNGSSRNSTFETRINGMQTEGFTMHDIGMIWAGRMISPSGIFADDNALAPNGEPTSRHVIFMTDGNTETGPHNTNSYGNYDMDGRFAGFAANGRWQDSDLGPIHNARLGAVCGQIKNKNVTIWTVTFGLAQNAHTKACASGNNRALESDNTAELIANFRAIATNIAELRLVK